MTAVTRYLCAGAYLDPSFARAVLDEVVTDPHRGVAPSPGVDVETVARHSLAALRRTLRRDVVLSVLLLVIAVVAGLRGVLIIVWLCSTVLVFRSARSLARSELSTALSQILIFLLISALCGFALLTQLSRSGYDGIQLLPVDSGTLVVLVLLALWAVNYLDRVSLYGVLAEKLSPAQFAPDPEFPVMGSGEQDRFRYVGLAQNSPLTFYSADAGPFVGFGPIVHAWTASCRLASSLPTVAVEEVYAAVSSSFSSSFASGFDIGDRVVVPGWVATAHPFVEDPPLRPVAGLPAAVVADIARRPGETETYYLTIHQPSPTGEAAVTGLVHADLSGQLLTIDVALAVLPPVDSRYRTLDSRRPGSAVLVAQMLGAAALDVLRVVPRAPLSLAIALRRTVLLGASERSDLGARVGVRELAGTGATQDFESTRAANLISRTVVAAVTGLLETQGFDPSDFSRMADQVWHKSLTQPSPEVAR